MSEQTNLNVGLEQITFQTQPDIVPGHVSLGAIAPANPQFELQLEEVLYIPASLEQRLVKALQPRITHRELQAPYLFHPMLDHVLKSLRSRSSRMKHSRGRDKLHKAIGTLEESKTLLDMLRRFQHALHRA